MARTTKKELKEQVEVLKEEVSEWKEATQNLTDCLDVVVKRNLKLLEQIEERDNDNRLLMTKVGELTLELAKQEEGR